VLALSDDPIRTDLDRRIADAKAAVRGDETGVRKPEKGYKQGSRVLAELIGAPAGGGILGYALDQWLGTTPWALLILLALSVVVAFRNIYKISKERAE
jgi:ATP synthase protein I